MHKSLHSHQYNDFLELLRTLRRRRGLRQSDLAQRLGRAQSLISRAESGERRLDVVELFVWLRALDMSLSAFSRDLEHRLDPAQAGSSVRWQARRARTREIRVTGAEEGEDEDEDEDGDDDLQRR